jgi:FtsZ-interacting cell division protein ZipA
LVRQRTGNAGHSNLDARKGTPVSTLLIVVVAVVVIVLVAALAASMRRRRVVKREEGRLEERRSRALETRQEAAEHEATAEQLAREADVHDERAHEAEMELAKRGH